MLLGYDPLDPDTDNDLLLCALYYRTYAEINDLQQQDVSYDDDWLLLKTKPGSE